MLGATSQSKTRSDVYSLGVLLYELVTGSTPLDDLKKRNFHEIRKAICSTDPVLASTRISKLGETVGQVAQNRNTDSQALKRFVRGELDWILAKCLARDRNHRYQSAGELAREIQRYLNGEVVEAARPTLQYRTRKFVVKHRTAVATAATIALILCSSTFVSVSMAMRARDAEQLATDRLDDVAAERDRAREAEKRLAVLERNQRRQSAMNQAIAMHNANMVKRHLGSASDGSIHEQDSIHVKPVSALWPIPSPDVPNSPGTSQSRQSRIEIIRSSGNPNESDMPNQWSFVDSNGCGNMEVVVMADEKASEADLLKCLVKVQRESFGPDDMSVAVTLNQLGEVMARQKNWTESEKSYREAIEIVKNLAHSDPDYLSEIRFGLVDCLKDKGDLEKAITEFNEFKDEVKESRFAEELVRQIENLKSGPLVDDKDADSDDDNNGDK